MFPKPWVREARTTIGAGGEVAAAWATCAVGAVRGAPAAPAPLAL